MSELLNQNSKLLNQKKRTTRSASRSASKGKTQKKARYSKSPPKPELSIPSSTPKEDELLGDLIFDFFDKNEEVDYSNVFSSPVSIDKDIILSINKSISSKEYSPEINKLLVNIRSASRKEVDTCNRAEWLNDYTKPLKIKVDNKCIIYSNPKVQEHLMKNLNANKHINPDLVITPKQFLTNCWFNTIFVVYFISDKGRKFFHFFRQSMIEGKTISKVPIKPKLRNAFAILNYAIESCIFGSEFAYDFDSNYIIKNIYENIPKYIKQRDLMVTENEFGNGFYYFNIMFEFLELTDMLTMKYINIPNNRGFGDWDISYHPVNVKDFMKEYIRSVKESDIPELFVIECNSSVNQISNDKIIKENKIKVGNYEYTLDSCLLRDNSKHHFAAFITCENKEYCFDGSSFRRLSQFDWKHLLNENRDFVFEKDEDYEKIYKEMFTFHFNFTIGYQLLFYYRTK